MFPAVLERYASLLKEESIVLVHGRVSIKEEETPKILCDEVKPLVKLNPKKLYIIYDNDKDEKLMHSTMCMLKYFCGNTPVYVYKQGDQKARVLERDYWVNLNQSLLSELKTRFGESNVKVL